MKYASKQAMCKVNPKYQKSLVKYFTYSDSNSENNKFIVSQFFWHPKGSSLILLYLYIDKQKGYGVYILIIGCKNIPAYLWSPIRIRVSGFAFSNDKKSSLALLRN